MYIENLGKDTISNLIKLMIVGNTLSEETIIVFGTLITTNIRKMLNVSNNNNGIAENLMGNASFLISILKRTKTLNHIIPTMKE
jgi:hypothetical protein